jgi:hypothetical protein
MESVPGFKRQYLNGLSNSACFKGIKSDYPGRDCRFKVLAQEWHILKLLDAAGFVKFNYHSSRS